MNRTSFAYAVLGALLIGVVMIAGLAYGGIFAFCELLLILCYRHYTERAPNSKPNSKINSRPDSKPANKPSKNADKKAKTPSAPKKKPAKALPKKLPVFGGTSSPSARPSAPVQTKPSTWKAPPRR